MKNTNNEISSDEIRDLLSDWIEHVSIDTLEMIYNNHFDTQLSEYNEITDIFKIS